MSPDSRLKRLAIATASFFLLIVGSLLGVPQIYLMAVAISLIPLVYWCLGMYLLRGVVCERKMPTSCQRGERVKVDLILMNPTSFTRFYIRVLDRLPQWVKFDGYDAGDAALVLSLSPAEQARVSYYMRPFRRGLQSIGPSKLSNPDLIGLSSYSTIINGTDSLLVYPKLLPINPQFFEGGGGTGWIDQENANTRGVGSDFQGVREYQTGDDLRRVNWKTTARTGTLAVTEYALGYVSDFTIALDLSPESYGKGGGVLDSSFETAIEIAASLAIAGLKQGSSVEIRTNGRFMTDETPLRGVDSSLSILSAFAAVEPEARSEFASVVTRFMADSSRGRALIVITGRSPLDTSLGAALDGAGSYRNGSSNLLFWIDTDAFVSTSFHHFLAPSEKGSVAPEIFRNTWGRNVIIRPDTDLNGLFAKVLV
jgi:uncharacterized protein (DUF58 family)